MQKKIADSIANGLKNYVEGNPNFDTRNIRPQVEGAMEPLTDSDTLESIPVSVSTEVDTSPVP
jgi:hypothetical protein